jgi:uncharacterized protein (DUF58 family)
MHYRSGAVSKLEYAKYMAASLAWLIAEQRDSVGLGVFDAGLRDYVEPSGAKAAVRAIAGLLEQVAPEPRTNVAGILHEFARRMRRRGFVLLFSDLFDHVEEFLKGLDHLRFVGHNVTVFHTLDPTELSFPFGGTCKFKGLELDGEISTQPRRIRAAYLEALKNFLERIRSACERSQVDYVLVDTSRPVDVVLANYLIGRIRSTGKKV